MKHVRQPDGAPLCGHACLAMVLGLTLDEAIEKMDHKRSTRTRELVAALGGHAGDKRLIPVRQRPVPQYAILKVTWEGKPRRGHFVLRIHSWIFDPLQYGRMLKHDWEAWLKLRGGRVTSALELSAEE